MLRMSTHFLFSGKPEHKQYTACHSHYGVSFAADSRPILICIDRHKEDGDLSARIAKLDDSAALFSLMDPSHLHTFLSWLTFARTIKAVYRQLFFRAKPWRLGLQQCQIDGHVLHATDSEILGARKRSQRNVFLCAKDGNSMSPIFKTAFVIDLPVHTSCWARSKQTKNGFATF